MIKALAIKELREIFPIAAVALGVQLVVVAALVGLKPFAVWLPLDQLGVPFGPRVLAASFASVGVVFTLLLGFRQSVWEAGQGTYKFLLHRPIQREVIFWTKLGTGAGVYLLCSLVPLLLYAYWAAIPGHYPGPFEWSMTGFAWRLCFLMPLVYLGAFLSGLRPARWYGTRLLPLAACGLLTAFLATFAWWWQLGFPLAVLTYAALVHGICHVARVRDYA
ncbi:MAG: OpgC domain-containing protein [Gemmataceae bacterium]|nr:OpgC domain-containing protein [Gemmataceae bacterium]